MLLFGRGEEIPGGETAWGGAAKAKGGFSRAQIEAELRANALDRFDIQIADEAMARVITYYTREAGVRQLEKELGKLSRKIVIRCSII